MPDSPAPGSQARAASAAEPGDWELFSHDADIGVRGRGRTLSRAFEQAALALTGVVTEPARVSCPEGPIEIECEAPDRETLLADWLNAVVFEMVVRGMLFARFEVTMTDCRLTARVWGEALDPARHRPAVEIKGATYTSLRVSRQPDGLWVAQCIVDV